MTAALRPAGRSEIAAALGVAPRTVHGWQRAGWLDPMRLHDPVTGEPVTVGGSPAYDLTAVEEWYAARPRRGRPPESVRARLMRDGGGRTVDVGTLDEPDQRIPAPGYALINGERVEVRDAESPPPPE